MVALAEISCAECKAKNLGGRRARCVKNCGYRYDAETDNYYVRNRYYSPILGRWLTRDPIGHKGEFNFYGHVESSPVGNVDAEGLAHTGRGGKGKRGGMTANTGRRKRKK
jgi:RHS repeat-associated protein